MQSRAMTTDDWVAAYRPKPAPTPGSGFDLGGTGDLLIDGSGPAETAALIAAPDGCVWTVVDGDEGGTFIVAGRHFVNRIGYIVTEVPCPEGDVEVDLDAD